MPHTEEAKAKMSKSHKGIPLEYKRRPTKIVNGITLYRCSHCHEFKTYESFYKNKRTLLGITTECKLCHSKVSIKTRNKIKAAETNRRSESKRRAKAVNAKISISYNDYKFLKKTFGKKCLNCGSEQNIQWDHIVPLAKGGEHTIKNLQPLCGHCNYVKHTKAIDYRNDEQISKIIEFERCEKPQEDNENGRR